MSMIPRLPPKAEAMPPDLRMPRTVKFFGPSMVRNAILLPVARPFRMANSRVTISESGCARKISGSSIASSPVLSKS
jgi:hypothetical protein